MREPIEELVGIEIQLGRDLRELVEGEPVSAFEHLDEIGNEPLVQRKAVAEDLEGVLAGVGIGLLRARFRRHLFRLRAFAHQLREQFRQSALVKFVVKRLRQLFSLGCGTAAHEFGDAHFGELLLQLNSTFPGGSRVQHDAFRRTACAFAQLGHILQVVIPK